MFDSPSLEAEARKDSATFAAWATFFGLNSLKSALVGCVDQTPSSAELAAELLSALKPRCLQAMNPPHKTPMLNPAPANAMKPAFEFI
jgi:hypothetical protein